MNNTNLFLKRRGIAVDQIYFASIGFIGMPGTIDKVAEENSTPLVMTEGMSRS